MVVLPQNGKFLFDRFGFPIGDGDCVVDGDRKVGYVRLEFGARRGRDSPCWDGWFSVTRTRNGHPARPCLAAYCGPSRAGGWRTSPD